MFSDPQVTFDKTSHTAELLKHFDQTPSDPLAVPVDNTFQNSQFHWLGFDCEDMQILNIGHNM